MKYVNAVLCLILFTSLACSGDTNDIQNDIPDAGGAQPVEESIWLIDKRLVVDGGPGKDGIPALTNPETISAESIAYLQDQDLVIGITNGTNQIAVPHKILDWHEIINMDNFGTTLAIVYCPLTGTGIGWNTTINGQTTTFGVSGLLYKNNIIPYDRATDSNWSQLELQCVNGELTGTIPETTVFPELTWGLWKKLFPDSRVVSTNTGFSRQYSIYPYGDYKSNNDRFIYPIPPLTNNIPSKERVYTIYSGDKAKVYRFQNFENGKIIKDAFDGKDYILIGNSEFIVSFELNETNKELDFSYEFNNTEVIMKDEQNNVWSIFGKAVSGPKKGQFLKTSHTAMMGYYFSVESFYPDAEFYN